MQDCVYQTPARDVAYFYIYMYIDNIYKKLHLQKVVFHSAAPW